MAPQATPALRGGGGRNEAGRGKAGGPSGFHIGTTIGTGILDPNRFAGDDPPGCKIGSNVGKVQDIPLF